jgi:hypothetical protein
LIHWSKQLTKPVNQADPVWDRARKVAADHASEEMQLPAACSAAAAYVLRYKGSVAVPAASPAPSPARSALSSDSLSWPARTVRLRPAFRRAKAHACPACGGGLPTPPSMRRHLMILTGQTRSGALLVKLAPAPYRSNSLRHWLIEAPRERPRHRACRSAAAPSRAMCL